MNLFKGLMKPKTDPFIDHLNRQAEIVTKGLKYLVEYMANPTADNAAAVKRAEEEADEERRLLIDELNRTFVTPIDREDLHNLSRCIDDLLDYANSTVEEMVTLRVAPNEHFQHMSTLMFDAANEIHLAMQRLESHPNVATEHARRAKGVENRMEHEYHRAIAELFEGPANPESIICMLKKREIYRHLSNAADRADEAANVISNIVVKMT